jgi:hypothetical protein
MADLDISAINANGHKLHNTADETAPPVDGDSPSSLSPQQSGFEVYSRGWVKQQRVALKRRLGVEATRQQKRQAVSVATKFVSTKDLLARADVVKKACGHVEAAAEPRSGVALAAGICASAELEESESERENWFVRLFRFMIVGYVCTFLFSYPCRRKKQVPVVVFIL